MSAAQAIHSLWREALVHFCCAEIPTERASA